MPELGCVAAPPAQLPPSWRSAYNRGMHDPGQTDAPLPRRKDGLRAHHIWLTVYAASVIALIVRQKTARYGGSDDYSWIEHTRLTAQGFLGTVLVAAVAWSVWFAQRSSATIGWVLTTTGLAAIYFFSLWGQLLLA